jgi:glycerol-3-phosphate dehydrogenase subunit B
VTDPGQGGDEHSTDRQAGVQARYDVIVVGAGLAGLFAGVLAARRGARTLVIGRGVGGTHLGTGTIDVWGYTAEGQPAEDPLAEAQRGAGPEHPLRLAGWPALEAGLTELQSLTAEAGYPLEGQLSRNHWLPTVLGAVRPTCLAPRTFTPGELREPGEITLGEIPGFRDFFADYAAANLNAGGHQARAVSLELPYGPTRRDAFATDLARLFDRDSFRASAAQLWRPLLKSAGRLGLPAILGYSEGAGAWRDLSERLGLPVFEIPLLPPSVPGMRLFSLLQTALEAAGGRLTIGPGVTGWLEAGRAAGIVAATAGGPRRYAAQHIILATGGFRHGGLHAPGPGQARETVFDLPVATGADWYAPVYWGQHPYARFGVRVNAAMRPLNPAGEVVYENVHAIGGLLAGADRHGEGSREGIDLATAHKAVQQLPLPAGAGAIGRKSA